MPLKGSHITSLANCPCLFFPPRFRNESLFHARIVMQLFATPTNADFLQCFSALWVPAAESHHSLLLYAPFFCATIVKCSSPIEIDTVNLHACSSDQPPPKHFSGSSVPFCLFSVSTCLILNYKIDAVSGFHHGATWGATRKSSYHITIKDCRNVHTWLSDWPLRRWCFARVLVSRDILVLEQTNEGWCQSWKYIALILAKPCCRDQLNIQGTTSLTVEGLEAGI